MKVRRETSGQSGWGGWRYGGRGGGGVGDAGIRFMGVGQMAGAREGERRRYESEITK